MKNKQTYENLQFVEFVPDASDAPFDAAVGLASFRPLSSNIYPFTNSLDQPTAAEYCIVL